MPSLNNILLIEEKLFFFFSVICSMTGLQIGGFALSNYVLLLCLLFSITKKTTYNLQRNSGTNFVILFFISGFFSILVSINLFPFEWISNAFFCLIKFFILFGYVFFLHSNLEIERLKNIFFNGFILGAIVQFIWGMLQIILYSFFEFKLNTFIFSNVLGLNQYVWDSYISGGILRLKGIGWEAANFAVVMVVAYCLSDHYRHSKFLKTIFIIGTLLSTSRSGYLSLAGVMIWQLLLIITSKRKLSLNKVIVMLCSVFVIFIFLFLFWDKILLRADIFITSLGNLFDKNEADPSASIHLSYYLRLLDVFEEIPVINALFGCGYFSIGYLYTEYLGLFPDRVSLIGWNPESDFITLLLGNGIIGAFIYYYYAVRSFFRHKKDGLGFAVLAILIIGITYLITRGSFCFLIIAFAAFDNKYKVANEKHEIIYKCGCI